MREVSIDASQNVNLEEEVSIETNQIEELESVSHTDAGSNLSEKDKEKKKVDELSEIHKPRVPFSSILKADSSSLESPPPLKLKLPLITLEYSCLESSSTLPVSIASNSTLNLKTQFMSILEE